MATQAVAQSVPEAFTPGPWELEGPEVTADGRDGEGWTIAYLGEPVDYVGLPKEDLSAAINAEIEANAKLIGAAPDLLAALVDIVEFCDDPKGSEKPESLGCGLSRLLIPARAALAKAKA